MKRFLAAIPVALIAAGFAPVAAEAADLVPTRMEVAPALQPVTVPPPRKDNSIFVFAGPLSTTTMGMTAMFNLTAPTKAWDNAIVGAAYHRDIWRFWGFTGGVEIGVADRFGQYDVCCDMIVKSSGLIHSGELWIGASIRHEGVLLFNTLRIAPGFVVGVSATTKSIGREREREITHDGNGRFLFYLGPELIFSTPALRDLELVMRLHHRSGAMRTLGKMEEGYNSMALGPRWRF